MDVTNIKELIMTTPFDNPIASNRAAAEAQTTQAETQHYAGGDAMLDAEAAVEEDQGDRANSDQPTATNRSGNPHTSTAPDVSRYTTTGDSPAGADQMAGTATPPAIAKDENQTT
jgi:hypothetical protein